MADFTYGDYDYTKELIPDPDNPEELIESGNVSVKVHDLNQVSYTAIDRTVEHGGKTYAVTDLTGCFERCTELTAIPTPLPSGIATMASCFKGCSNLDVDETLIPSIPDSVTDLSSCFQDCVELTHSPQIPSSVTNLNSCFNGCTKLTTAPESIPESVENLDSCFEDCINLTLPGETITIPSSVTSMNRCFAGCVSLKGDINVSNTPSEYSYLFYGTEKWIYLHPQDLLGLGENTWRSIASRYSNVYYITAKSDESGEVISETDNTSFLGIKKGGTTLNLSKIHSRLDALETSGDSNTSEINSIKAQITGMATGTGEGTAGSNIITVDADVTADGKVDGNTTKYDDLPEGVTSVSNSFMAKAVKVSEVDGTTTTKESEVGATKYTLNQNGNAVLDLYVQDKWKDESYVPQTGMRFIANAKTRKREFQLIGGTSADFYKGIRMKPAYAGFKNSNFSTKTTTALYTEGTVKFTDAMKYQKEPRVFLQIQHPAISNQSDLEKFCQLRAVVISATKDQFTWRLYNPAKKSGWTVRINWMAIPNNSDGLTW